MHWELYILIAINVLLVISIFSYYIYNRFIVGGKRFNSKEINNLKKKMKAEYFYKGFYTSKHELIFGPQFDYFYVKDREDFSVCFDCFVYENSKERWEVFISYDRDELLPDNSEKLTIRVFTKNATIKSRAMIEKVLSQISILSNNNYLIRELNKNEIKEEVEDLIKSGKDTLLLDRNIIQYKTTSFPKNISSRFIINRVKIMKRLRDSIVKEGILEY